MLKFTSTYRVLLAVMMCISSEIYASTSSLLPGILTLVCSINIKPQDIECKGEKKVVYELIMPYNHSRKERVN